MMSWWTSCYFCEIRKACQGKIWDNEYNIIVKVLNGIDGSTLFQLILTQENTYTVDLLMMLLTSLEHLLLMNLLKIILKRLINLLFKTVHICSFFFEFLYFTMGQPHAKPKLFLTSIVFWLIKVCCRVVEHVTLNP